MIIDTIPMKARDEKYERMAFRGVGLKMNTNRYNVKMPPPMVMNRKYIVDNDAILWRYRKKGRAATKVR